MKELWVILRIKKEDFDTDLNIDKVKSIVEPYLQIGGSGIGSIEEHISLEMAEALISTQVDIERFYKKLILMCQKGVSIFIEYGIDIGQRIWLEGEEK